MVQFMSSENNNVWQLPQPEAKSYTVEGNSMYFQQTGEEGPLPKRWKSSSSSSSASSQTATQLNNNGIPTQSQNNLLSEPSPLGLRLRKSPSLLELAQKRLNQVNTDKGDLPVEDLEAGINRDLRERARTRDRARASGSVDKLKASHFPALILRIGQWEYVSKHEGDLVAKCYFSKHKIVWEVLDGGLKKKFEINWADIVALKADTAADGIGTLTIVLDKPPLFFKEINPQPRKHTQWRATSDFTDGEASTHRQHLLQCAQGVLEKHYEKLINCDTRLNFLSQQQDIFLEFPYFAPKASITNQDISGNSSFNLSDMYGIANMTSASALQACLVKPLESSSLSLIHQDLSKQTLPSNSVMATDPGGEKDMDQMLPATISISDLVNHNGNSGLSEQKTSGNPTFFDDHVSGQETPKDVLENISQILLSDNHLTAASDEKTLMSRVNSLCCLIQDHQNDQQDGNDRSTLDPNLVPGIRTQEDGIIGQSSKLPQDHPNGQQDGNDDSNPESNPMPENETPQDENVSEPGMSRKDSFAELVHQLPRIASLPRFLFDISENGEILK